MFGRYELFDTQNKMPAGYLPLEEFQRSAWIVGATYYPDPDVAFKFDYVRERNKSSVVKRAVADQFGCGVVVLVMREVNVAGILFLSLALALPVTAAERETSRSPLTRSPRSPGQR